MVRAKSVYNRSIRVYALERKVTRQHFRQRCIKASMYLRPLHPLFRYLGGFLKSERCLECLNEPDGYSIVGLTR